MDFINDPVTHIHHSPRTQCQPSRSNLPPRMHKHIVRVIQPLQHVVEGYLQLRYMRIHFTRPQGVAHPHTHTHTHSLSAFRIMAHIASSERACVRLCERALASGPDVARSFAPSYFKWNGEWSGEGGAAMGRVSNAHALRPPTSH